MRVFQVCRPTICSIIRQSVAALDKDITMIADVNLTTTTTNSIYRDVGNDEEGGTRYGSIDQIIEISLLKITKIQGLQMRDERPRLLVTETLQKAMAEKIISYRKEEDSDCDNVTAYARILQSAIQRLGLSRCIKITLEMPENPADYPKIRIPLIGRKAAKDTHTHS